MEQSVSNSIFIPNGKGTKSLNGTDSASDPQLITRRSVVQIHPPATIKRLISFEIRRQPVEKVQQKLGFFLCMR